MKRIQLLLSLGLASALLLAACGGNDDDNGDGADSGNTPANGEQGATNTPSNGGGGNGGDASELEDLIGRLVDRTFKATFESKTMDEGVEQTGTMSIAQDRPRYAMTIATPDGDFGVYENSEGTFSCFGSDGFGQCSRGSLLGGSIFDLRNIAEDEDDLSTYRRVDDRNVGGRDSRCWQGVDSETNTQTVVCLSKSDGFLTYIGSEGFEMTLQEFSNNVSDEDFELPYSVM